ncbi:MAG: hypothetical protein NZ742_04335 [Acidobacteria bacterium]|nr:hypothetical protein [Acidobacteriota bacterium]MDW7984151.1 hypothetical protein [Acidobacteriota bacterium]
MELTRKLLIPPDREVDEFVERRPTAELRSSILYFVPSKRRPYFFTLWPFSLTEVDARTGAYCFIPLRGDAGSHFEDLAWSTSGTWQTSYQGRESLWLLSEGTIVIERSRSSWCLRVETSRPRRAGGFLPLRKRLQDRNPDGKA